MQHVLSCPSIVLEIFEYMDLVINDYNDKDIFKAYYASDSLGQYYQEFEGVETSTAFRKFLLYSGLGFVIPELSFCSLILKYLIIYFEELSSETNTLMEEMENWSKLFVYFFNIYDFITSNNLHQKPIDWITELYYDELIALK